MNRKALPIGILAGDAVILLLGFCVAKILTIELDVRRYDIYIGVSPPLHCNDYEYTQERLELYDCRGESEPLVFLAPANVRIVENPSYDK